MPDYKTIFSWKFWETDDKRRQKAIDEGKYNPNFKISKRNLKCLDEIIPKTSEKKD